MTNNSKDIQELIDKIRGKTEAEKTKDTVDAILKAEKEITDEKAKVKAEADKTLLDNVKAAEKKLKEDAIKEEAEKKKKEASGSEEEENSGEDSEDEEEEEDDDVTIKKLTKQMEKMAEEVKALKKRKNYRTKPPKSKKVDAKDLPDFILQNTQNIQNKDYEVMC